MQEGNSLLYEASSRGRTEAVRLLLQNGADVNLPTEVILIRIVLSYYLY